MPLQIQFTFDGEPLGDPVEVDVQDAASFRYNDIHLEFERSEPGALVAVEFTKDGEIVGIPVDGVTVGSLVAPFEADHVGFDLRIEAHDFKIFRVYWTKNREKIGEPKNAPTGANDVHVILSHKSPIKKVWWTHDRKPIDRAPPIEVPEDANDFHMGDSEHFPWNKKAK
jgi:hypothetical protein